MPEVEFTPGGATDAACAKPTQGGTMPGAVVQVAGIADDIVVVPALPQGATPGLGGNVGCRDVFSHLHILPEEDRSFRIWVWSLAIEANGAVAQWFAKRLVDESNL